MQLLVRGYVSRSWHLLGPHPAYVYIQPCPSLLHAMGTIWLPSTARTSWHCSGILGSTGSFWVSMALNLCLCLVLSLAFICNAQLTELGWKGCLDVIECSLPTKAGSLQQANALNLGRGSFQAVGKQLFTKMKNCWQMHFHLKRVLKI